MWLADRPVYYIKVTMISATIEYFWKIIFNDQKSSYSEQSQNENDSGV